MEQLYFGKKEVCKMLGISVPTLDRMVASGEFSKPTKVGSSLKWHRTIIERWIDENESKQRGNLVWLTGHSFPYLPDK